MTLDRRAFLAGVTALPFQSKVPSVWVDEASFKTKTTLDSGVVSVAEVSMAASNVVCVEVRDTVVRKGRLLKLSAPDPAPLNSTVLRNPVDGTVHSPLSYAKVVGLNKNYLRFYDEVPDKSQFLVRSKSDVVENYAKIGSRSVVSVRRVTVPYDQGIGWGGGQFNIATFKHYIYLTLDHDLLPGPTYTITCKGDPFPPTTFLFNDKKVRAKGIHATQMGHRASDGDKRAFLAQWIPGFGNEGRVDFVNLYGVSRVHIIDADGNPVYTIVPQLRSTATAIEPVLGPTIIDGGAEYKVGDLLKVLGGTGVAAVIKVIGVDRRGSIKAVTWFDLGAYTVLPADPVLLTGGSGQGAKLNLGMLVYTSSTTPPKTFTNISKGSPGRVTCPDHGFKDGEVKLLLGVGGMDHLEGAKIKVANSTANEFDLHDLRDRPIDTSAFRDYQPMKFLSEYDSKIYNTFSANRAATYVYEIDYSGWIAEKPGFYRLWIPGLGVSDQFAIDEAIHRKAATFYMQGYYNQSSGIALDPSVGGWERPVDYRDGRNDVTIHESLAPAFFVDETGTPANPKIPSRDTANQGKPFVTGNQVAGWGGSVRDAGDWDYHAYRHCPMAYSLLEFGYLQLPSKARDLKLGYPNASVIVDPVLYAAIDALGDQVHMAIFQLDVWRKYQKSDGRIYGGLQFDGNGGGSGGGGNTYEPSFISQQKAVLLAADPASNYTFAFAAAKLAQVFRETGFSSLASIWEKSAVRAWDWAEHLYQDFKLNGATGKEGSPIDLYFVGALNLPSNAGWNGTTGSSSGTYFTSMKLLFADCENLRRMASATLFNLTNSTSYGDIVGGISFGAVPAGFALSQTGISGLAVWEWCQAPNARLYLHPMKQTAYYENRWLSTIDAQFANQLSRANSSYPYGGNGNFFGPSDPTYLIVGFLKSSPKVRNNKYLNLMHVNGNFCAGANQNGITCTTGMGVRDPDISLIRDREAMGIESSQVRGTTLYTWWWSNAPGLPFDNFGTDSNLNFTVSRPSAKGKLALERTIDPPIYSLPAMEQYWANSYCIYNTEFTTQQDIVPMFINALWRHCWDGSTAM